MDDGKVVLGGETKNACVINGSKPFFPASRADELLAVQHTRAHMIVAPPRSTDNMRRSILIALASTVLTACASPNTGIVPIGDGLYMSSKPGGMLTYTGGEVKADLYRDAAAFCAKQGKGVMPVNSSSQNSGLAAYASAEIQFRCGGSPG